MRVNYLFTFLCVCAAEDCFFNVEGDLFFSHSVRNYLIEHILRVHLCGSVHTLWMILLFVSFVSMETDRRQSTNPIKC